MNNVIICKYSFIKKCLKNIQLLSVDIKNDKNIISFEILTSKKKKKNNNHDDASSCFVHGENSIFSF